MTMAGLTSDEETTAQRRERENGRNEGGSREARKERTGGGKGKERKRLGRMFGKKLTGREIRKE